MLYIWSPAFTHLLVANYIPLTIYPQYPCLPVPGKHHSTTSGNSALGKQRTKQRYQSSIYILLRNGGERIWILDKVCSMLGSNDSH